LFFSPSIEPERLRGHGIEVVHIPLFRVKCLEYRVDLTPFEGVAFTSKNSVECFRDWDKVKNKKIFAIGKSTHELITSKGFFSVYPEKYDSAHLARLILQSGVKSVMAFRSRKATPCMRNILSGSIKYEEIYDYDVEPIEENLRKAERVLRNREVEVVAITSSEIAKMVASFLTNEIKVVSIGPMTSKTLSSLRPDITFIESNEHDFEGIIKALGEK
jgi:uroporphyrinogen-III synthase